jgi:hypothetical protein
MIQAKVKFTLKAAAHLHETPLRKDQTIEELTDDRAIVIATVRDTAQL